ncbi:MAG: SDR family NAD(P)-dependent oxidoreductase, partial [Anaerolineae bacterium]|nr:SDR family NAD(P)-dependent oxidoreductase [Anaerolineae bacterium]
AIAVTQSLLPMLRTGRGRVVNISSGSGLIALPFFGPYAASKFALEAISDSWRVELKPWGIWVALVEPGVVDTPMREKVIATLRKAREAYPPEAHELYGQIFGAAERQEERGIPAVRVAKVVEHALFANRPERRYLVGADTILLSIFRRLPAWFRDWYIARHIATHHRPVQG